MDETPKTYQERVVMGVELESYTIQTPTNIISRQRAIHRKGTSEKGERFTRDWTIGTEYNSRPFSTIREGLFLLKTGLRKYNSRLYRSKGASQKGRQIFLVGGWRDRFAGAHIHISVAGRVLSFVEAKKIAARIHDHLPLLIAMGANSPVWADEITPLASNRVLKGSKKYFYPIMRYGLKRKEFDEMTFSRGRKTKPPTLEVRVMDSNIPEFVMAAACVVKACVLAALRNKKITNRLSHYRYLRSRQNAARNGMRAKLCWNGEWMSASDYLDRLVWTFRREFKEMDIPQEIWVVFKLLKRGVNGSHILAQAAMSAHKRHPQTWQRRFAKKYAAAIEELLDGNSITSFMDHLGVEVPALAEVWLGRRRLKLL